MSVQLSTSEDYSDSVDLTRQADDYVVLIRSRDINGGIARINADDIDGYIEALQAAKEQHRQRVEAHQRWQDSLKE